MIKRSAVVGRVSQLLALPFCVYQPAALAVSSTDIYESICLAPGPPPPEWDLGQLVNFCFDLNPGGPAGGVSGPGALSSQLSSTGQGSTLGGGGASQAEALRKKLQEAEDAETGRGASADFQFGSLGLTLALQKGENERRMTARESGYNADTRGGLAAVDYQFSDQLIGGVGIARTEVNADLDRRAGSFNVESTGLNLFATYLPTDSTYLSMYLGYSDLDYDARRNLTLAGTPYVISGKTNGTQRLAGLAGGWNWFQGDWTVSPFLNIDYAYTRLDGYAESGTSLLEMRYDAQRSKSLTSGLGLRVSRASSFDWGTLLPEARVIYTHEFQDDARSVTSQLVTFPGPTFATRTDSPDRDYFSGAWAWCSRRAPTSRCLLITRPTPATRCSTPGRWPPA